MKYKIIECVKINCYAFTTITIITELFYLVNHYSKGKYDNIRVFAITTMIAIMIELIECLNLEKKSLKYLIEMLTATIYPIGVSFLFYGSELQLSSIIFNVVISIGVFVIVSSLFFLESTIDANKINIKIKKI